MIKVTRKVVFLALLLASSVLFLIVHRKLQDTKVLLLEAKNVAVSDEPTTKSFERPIYLLDWTLFFDKPLPGYHLESCPELNCQLITNRSRLNESSALVFHLANLKWNDLPAHRQPHQIYSVLSHESPSNIYLNLALAKQFFNVSLTYRSDSTIPLPYGMIQRRPRRKNVSDEELVQIVRNKTKLVAWFVSNCAAGNAREKYVKELAKHIQVDIFGKCSNRSLDRTKGPALLRNHYKFYLAFENSDCKDYVTEKFMCTFFDDQYVVPVVLWGRNYGATGAPPDSFVAADAFDSPAKLARHLRQLAEDEVRYTRMLDSRRYFHHTGLCPRCGLCRLCQLTRQPTFRNVIADFGAWWNGPGVCDKDLVRRLLDKKKGV